MHALTSRRRWAWTLIGAVVALLLLLPASFQALAPWGAWHLPQKVHDIGIDFGHAEPLSRSAGVQIVSQPVTSVTVQSYGMPVQVTAGSVRRVQITERMAENAQANTVPIIQSVTDGHLTVADPTCQVLGCQASFALVVPASVAVTVQTGGGEAVVSGVASTTVDSGGGPVQVSQIHGPLTVSSSGGEVTALGLSGAADTISSGGGPAQVEFTTAPRQLTVSTAGGSAGLTVPGGPYALTADTHGGAETVQIPTDSGASRWITVGTGGGPLKVMS